MLMLLTGFACLILFLYIVARIWKTSALLAIVSFFFWPAMIVALFKYWGDEESDIKVPFFILVALTILMFNLQVRFLKEYAPQQESLLAVARFFA